MGIPILQALRALFPQKDPDYLFSVLTELHLEANDDSEFNLNTAIERLFELEHSTTGEVPETSTYSDYYYLIRRTWVSDPIYIMKPLLSETIGTLEKDAGASKNLPTTNPASAFTKQLNKLQSTQDVVDLFHIALSHFIKPDDLSIPASQYRQEAAKMWLERQELLAKASSAFQKNKNSVSRSIASHYADQARILSNRMKEIHLMAAYSSLVAFNTQIVNQIDLHGLYVAEALCLLFPILYK
jgi:Domain of unknown function (DUF1771)